MGLLASPKHGEEANKLYGQTDPCKFSLGNSANILYHRVDE
jgi:hypothetical protein